MMLAKKYKRVPATVLATVLSVGMVSNSALAMELPNGAAEPGSLDGRMFEYHITDSALEVMKQYAGNDEDVKGVEIVFAEDFSLIEGDSRSMIYNGVADAYSISFSMTRYDKTGPESIARLAVAFDDGATVDVTEDVLKCVLITSADAAIPIYELELSDSAIPAPKPEMYTVSFDKQDGTAPDEVQVESGMTVEQPADPTREGFLFAGWMKDGVAFDFDTPVTGDITLCAQWTADDNGNGSENNGDENNGSENNGDENNGDENNGSENNGDENNGDENNGDENNGDENNGSENNGSENNGDENNGDENNGDENNGDENTGSENTGDENTGSENTGDENTGSEVSGNASAGSSDQDEIIVVINPGRTPAASAPQLAGDPVEAPEESESVEEMDLAEEDVPLAEQPQVTEEMDLAEETVPLAEQPEVSAQAAEVHAERSESASMGELPQTGAVADAVNPALTAGLAALALSMAGCGLYFSCGRKQDEEA